MESQGDKKMKAKRDPREWKSGRPREKIAEIPGLYGAGVEEEEG